jgi:competence protein ComEC
LACAGFTDEEGNPLEVHFLNVGYGDSILIKFPNQTNLLIDSGRKEYGARIVEYLKAQGVTRINAALLTHPHDNHFGGFSAVFKAFPVEKFYLNGDNEHADKSYMPFFDELRGWRIPLTVLKRGQRVDSSASGIAIEVLHPDDFSGSANENAVVLWLSYGETHFLFTGDINDAEQDEMIRLYPKIKSADCIQIPHHGKDVSDVFAEFFKRRLFIVSTGVEDGRVPNLRPLTKLKGRVLRTDLVGPVVLKSDGKTVKIGSR